ncbi:MAG: L-seryl-tRNA(Sec) selenium transferase [Actinomycetota bacterium]|nr:L-seryl-tRNA(Sec) selenium transferase [Actinomycetota bacterium]
MGGSGDERLRALPAVDRVVGLLGEMPPRTAAALARRAVDAARERVKGGAEAPSAAELAEAARRLAEEDRLTRLIPVVNATGVLVHTNLGRVPLGPEQLDAVAVVAGGYSNLEYDLAAGARGTRYAHARMLIAELTGAADALVVNNCAAAVLLVLSTLCARREVLISRGELIEIGGEFRIPEVMAASGARLVEVGTTNRTHLADFERAITPATAAILKVHPSNYRVVGFAASVAGRDLARLARGRGMTFVHDLGSGLVTDAPWGESDEPVVTDAVAEGADLVTFSGDKLLGGPQAGVIAGRADLVGRLAENPLLRALRVDKMTLAALEATLVAYGEGREASLPLWALATTALETLEERARSIVASVQERVGAVKLEAVPTRAVAGGGSMPGADFGSWAVAVRHPERGPDEVAARLRRAVVPVVGRIEEGLLLLDLRAVPSAADAHLVDALGHALT